MRIRFALEWFEDYIFLRFKERGRRKNSEARRPSFCSVRASSTPHSRLIALEKLLVDIVNLQDGVEKLKKHLPTSVKRMATLTFLPSRHRSHDYRLVLYTLRHHCLRLVTCIGTVPSGILTTTGPGLAFSHASSQ